MEANYAALEQLLDEIAAGSSDACSDAVVAELAERHERVVRRMESIGNRRILDVSDREAFRVSGSKSLIDFCSTRLRITRPRRRLRAVQHLEAMHAMTGELLPPRAPNTAAGLADGHLGAEHVDAILDVLAKVPAAVDPDETAKAESALATEGRRLTPREITQLGVRILAYLDPDGTLTDDRDRARNRRLSLSAQDAQLMSKLSGTLDPTTRALFEVVLAAWAAPGMNNPDDDQSPRGDTADIDPDLLREAAGRDSRSVAQRNHDALKALLQCAADGGLLGASHRGLPPHIIISITESELRDRAGVANTATGTDLPITDVLTLAARAQMHLAVFDDHTAEPLFLGRAHRLASQAQRFVLFAKYGGCGAADCPTPFAHCEIHHADKDWADGGTTDVNHLAPACGPHNRAVGPNPDQWTTDKITTGPDRGRYGWRRNTDPPEEIHANHRHHIRELLDRHGDDDPWADTGEATLNTEPATADIAPDAPWGEPDTPPVTTPGQDPWSKPVAPQRPPPAGIEHHIAYQLVKRIPRPAGTPDINWPRRPAVYAPLGRRE
ncbi:HNH endonuclease signature motif containing protein [Williamsia phyllosphaerae]|uniref:HNH endonuclease signature motif containing protein n=1 Tax=Williamsia phyllosphaerae TaxID=885042 RepID=UPI001E3C4CC5|nr:HNH endonuclease signature motif containing protein [Williamsia phyllosphaerae]